MRGSLMARGGFWGIFILLLLSTDISARRPGSGGGSGGSGSGGSGSGGSGSGGSGSGGSGSGGSGSGGSGSGGGGSGSGGGGSGSGGGGTGGVGSGGQQHTYPPSNGWSGTSYRPPQQIQHGANSFPVSTTPPPTYVYQMRDSGSRYNNLVTGLMLWNIARRPSNTGAGSNCRFRLTYNGTSEYRRVDCQSISSFIQEWENGGNNSTAGTGNVTFVDNDNYNPNNTVDALEDKGQSILVRPGMTCHIVRTVNRRSTSQEVDCMVLQLYTSNSWRPTNEAIPGSAKTLTATFLIPILTILVLKL